MATAAVAVPEKRLFSTGWIINQKDDLVWFIASVVVSYAMLAANLTFGVSVAVLVWIWALGFDGPHVFATVSRTYADSQERRKRAALYYGSFALFLVGPAMVLAGRVNLFGTDVWGPLFFVFASMWAYYHLVKQHYGFMVLYKKKNNDLAETDNFIDRAFILTGMTYPFLHYIGHSSAASRRLPFSVEADWFSWIETLAFYAFVVSLLAIIARQAQRLYLRQPVNLPKLLLLAAAVPMHWTVLRMLEPVGAGGATVAVATLTIYHNIQYHRIVWFHNQNKYARAGASDYGAASFISRTVWRYILCALLFGAAYHVPHYTLVAPDGFWMAFIWGGAFIHYYLDSKIWRVRRDAQLNENLRMAEAVKA